MEPITRVEKYLSEIAENTRNGGGSGGGGSESNVLVVNMSMETVTLDKTWQEIVDADFAIITIASDANTKQWLYISSVEIIGSYYAVNTQIEGSDMRFRTDSPNGYPVMDK